MMQNLKSNWHAVLKFTWGVWQNLTKHSKVSEIYNLMGFFSTKFMFEPKKYRRVIFHNIEEWFKVWRWRNTDLWFGGIW